MKINYPEIAWADVQEGDTILAQWAHTDGSASYLEFEVATHSEPSADATYYLIDRPKPIFPEDYGTLIIAKKVRGIEFPEGVVLARQRGSAYSYAHSQPMWKSLDRRISGADQHGERQIEDWVLAKAVPA